MKKQKQFVPDVNLHSFTQSANDFKSKVLFLCEQQNSEGKFHGIQLKLLSVAAMNLLYSIEVFLMLIDQDDK